MNTLFNSIMQGFGLYIGFTAAKIALLVIGGFIVYLGIRRLFK